MSDLASVEIFDKPGDRRRWWKPSEKVRWMLRGALYMLALVFVLVVLAGGWIVWIRSVHGQIAYEYIQQVIAQQQQLQQQQQQQQGPRAGHPEAPPTK